MLLASLSLTVIIFLLLLYLIYRDFTSSKTELSDSDKEYFKEQEMRIKEIIKDSNSALQLFFVDKLNQRIQDITKNFHEFKETLTEAFHQTKVNIIESLSNNAEKQNKSFLSFQEKLNKSIQEFEKMSSEKLTKSLENMTEQLGKNIKELNKIVDNKLTDITDKVEQKLSKGFEKTNETFVKITERLVKIDEAQKKIESLSQDVGSLQNILTDKKTRGIFGEVQLNQILISVFGENNQKLYSIQKQIGSEGLIADAVLYLPEPLGIIPVDSKFPMENYEKMLDINISKNDQENARKTFKINIKKHISDIAEKYIIPGETSQAILFLPAEAIFAEINAYHLDLIEYARMKNVWIVSPSTFMALLTTIQSVLKNIETQKQAKVIQGELIKLSQEFSRYKLRWGNLSKHINQVSKDVKDITVTTEKISDRFVKIEKVEIEDDLKLTE